MNGLTSEEVKWIVPEEVLGELRGLQFGGKIKIKERNAATIGIEIVKDLGVEVVKLSSTANDVDTKIVNYLRGKKIILATLDRKLKSRIKNKILTIRGKKTLTIT
jgi:rRNA-processing protein FCF1|tara:strand:+ start:1322 stop:1636 length:315 start_codon:yes stop_codon:yes gene_type:complete